MAIATSDPCASASITRPLVWICPKTAQLAALNSRSESCSSWMRSITILRLNEKNDGAFIAQSFFGAETPDFHSYKPGDSVAGALTRMVNVPLLEISTSTNSRALIVQANDSDAVSATATANNGQRNDGLAKFKQYGLMVRVPRIEIDFHALDARR